MTDLPNGLYAVTITMGDAAAYRDDMGVILEGGPIDLVTTPVGTAVRITYQVVVDEGQLSLELADFGGRDPYAVINAIEISDFASWQFDFGGRSSPVAAGWLQVQPSTTYSPAGRYGWLGGSIAARDRGAGDDVTRDLNFTSDGAFALDVGVGLYQVTVTLGDASHRHDQMGIAIEGILADTVSTAANEFVTVVFEAPVDDGQLNVRLEDLGGSDRNVVIDGLEVVGQLPVIEELIVPSGTEPRESELLRPPRQPAPRFSEHLR